MAKQLGPFFIEGTINGITFYKSGGQYLVRIAGGPDKKKILHSPKFENTRRNINEFGNCSKDSTFLRRRLSHYFMLNDPYLYQRLTKLFTLLKNHDTVSVYGQRRISLALQNKEAQLSMRGFSFNKKSMHEVLACQPVINNRHHISLPFKNIIFPAGANRVVINAVRFTIDFENKRCSTDEYGKLTLNNNNVKQIIRLQPLNEVSNDKGRVLYFLQFRFYNNVEAFNNGINDSLACIAIDPVLENDKNISLIKGELLPASVLYLSSFNKLLPLQKTRILLKAAPD